MWKTTAIWTRVGPLGMAALALCVASGASGQTLNYARHVDGRVWFGSADRTEFFVGDTLEARLMVMNASDSLLSLPEDLCAIELRTEAALEVVQRMCSSPDLLEPGQSVWVDIRATLEGPPGSYDFELLGVPLSLGATFTLYGDQLASDTTLIRRGFEPALVAYTIELSEGAAGVSVRDVQAIVDDAAHQLGSNLIPVRLDPRAAENHNMTSSQFRVSLDLTSADNYGVRTCWVLPQGEEETMCNAHSGSGSLLHLGARLHSMVRRALEQAARRPGAERP